MNIAHLVSYNNACESSKKIYMQISWKDKPEYEFTRNQKTFWCILEKLKREHTIHSYAKMSRPGKRKMDRGFVIF